MQQILMRHISYIMAACAFAAMTLSCGPKDLERSLEDTGWPSECPEGYLLGVSAPFCGLVDGMLISAGGANFPDMPAAYGGSKKIYSGIFLLKSEGWVHAGELPTPGAYGGCLNVCGNLFAVGGNNGDEAVSDVFIFRVCGDEVTVEPTSPLPVGIEQAGYACEDSTIYVAGGLTPFGVNEKVYAGKVHEDGVEWTEIASMPETLVQPVAFHSGGCLYVWGGFDPIAKTVSCKGWKFNESTGGWTLLEEGSETFTGASVTVLSDGRLAAVGGVDKDVFAYGLSAVREKKHRYMMMEPEEYGFNRSLRIFDPDTEEWSCHGEADALALAGAGAASDADGIHIVGGEIKPGIRTPRSWKLKLR